MTDAPERIWARPNYDKRHIGGWDTRGNDGGTEYIRADLIPAMLKAAEQRGREAEREAILAIIDRDLTIDPWVLGWTGWKMNVAGAVSAIRARANGEGEE